MPQRTTQSAILAKGTQNRTGGSDRQYRADIDGLRAIAVIAVVLFHAGVSPVRGGFIGVDIFFVISGYLINGLILRDAAAGAFTFLQFYARRFRRILPALLTVIFATILTGWFLLDSQELKELAATATTAALGASNFSFWRHQEYFAPDANLAPLLMTWTLGVEEQFYVVVPALTLVLSRNHPQRVAVVLLMVTVASFLFSLWCTTAYPTAAFYLLPARAWELGVGGALAGLQLRNGGGALLSSSPWREGMAGLGLALLAVSIFGLDSAGPFPGLAAALPVTGTAMLIASEGSWVNRTLLAVAPMRWIGLVSYSWYLWHWPLMSFLRIVAIGPPPLWLMLLVALASLILAALTWRLIEQPLRRRKLSSASVIQRYAAVVCASAVASSAIAACGGEPWRLPQTTRAVEAVIAGGRGDCLAPWGVDRPDLSRACVATVAGRPAMALLGDSHAAALGPGLRDLAARRGEGVIIMTKSECQPLLRVAVWRSSHPSLARKCENFVQRSLGAVVADPSINLVFLAASWGIDGGSNVHYVADPGTLGSEAAVTQEELLTEGLAGMVQTLRSHGKSVVIVGDGPSFSFDVGRLAITRTMPVRAGLSLLVSNSAPAGEWEAANPEQYADRLAFRSLFDKYSPGVSFLDVYDQFCNIKACRFEVSNVPLFIDNAHLSKPGSRVVFAGAVPF